MRREDILTSKIRWHDSKLYVERNREGKLCVFRKGYRLESYILDGGQTLSVPRLSPHFVFALTHDWKATGRPVDWGIEPILAKLKASDLWHRDIVADIEEQERKRDLANDRDLHNKTEDYLYEARNDFKKAFADVNTGSMVKKDKRRIKEKSEKFKT